MSFYVGHTLMGSAPLDGAGVAALTYLIDSSDGQRAGERMEIIEARGLVGIESPAIFVTRAEGMGRAREARMAANRLGAGSTPPANGAPRGSQRPVSRTSRRSRTIGPCS